MRRNIRWEKNKIQTPKKRVKTAQNRSNNVTRHLLGNHPSSHLLLSHFLLLLLPLLSTSPSPSGTRTSSVPSHYRGGSSAAVALLPLISGPVLLPGPALLLSRPNLAWIERQEDRRTGDRPSIHLLSGDGQKEEAQGRRWEHMVS